MTKAWNTQQLQGELHLFIALDWGDAVNLELAQQLRPGELQTLPRRLRTPSSIGYSTAPLLYTLPDQSFDFKSLGQVTATTELAVFDFGGVSLSWRIPFALSPSELLDLAVECRALEQLGTLAQQTTQSLYEQLLSAIENPALSPLTEDYLVFAVNSHSCSLSAAELVTEQSTWLAQLVRLEREPLSEQEINSILSSKICYGLRDLLLPEWSAALLLDTDCEETLQTIEFANLQLLEYRYIDNLLDRRLSDATNLIQPLARSWLPFWRAHHRSLRSLGELRVTAHSLFERTGNTLKLVGDQYLAKVYKLLAERFHLPEWGNSIERSLDTVESAYQVVSDQAAMFRTEFMEAIVIFLIALEIVLSLFRH